MYNREPGAQIDLLIYRADHCINLCEMKFSKSDYTLTAADAKALQHKILAYQNATKTNNTIFTTLITPHGLTSNNWSDQYIDNVVTLTQLF